MKDKDKIIGDNTDIEGFRIGLEKTNQVIKNKKSMPENILFYLFIVKHS